MAAGTETRVVPKPDRVFVVHGRNDAARKSMFQYLRGLGLNPLEWSQAVEMTGEGSPYIGRVLDVAFENAQAIVVLLTPDEIAYLQPQYGDGDGDPETQPSAQARPNVLFEAGMALGRNAARTILVELGELRPFTDVLGRHAIRMGNGVPQRKALASRLRTAGCPVDMTGDDWLTVGDFTPPEKPGGVLPLGRRAPSSERRGASVDAHWYSSGGNKLDQLKVTNNGAVPIFDVRVHVPETLTGVQIWQEDPVHRLPAGKSFTIRAHNSSHSLGAPGPQHFDLNVLGRLEDGREFHQEVFIDAEG